MTLRQLEGSLPKHTASLRNFLKCNKLQRQEGDKGVI